MVPDRLTDPFRENTYERGVEEFARFVPNRHAPHPEEGPIDTQTQSESKQSTDVPRMPWERALDTVQETLAQGIIHDPRAAERRHYRVTDPLVGESVSPVEPIARNCVYCTPHSRRALVSSRDNRIDC